MILSRTPPSQLCLYPSNEGSGKRSKERSLGTLNFLYMIELNEERRMQKFEFPPSGGWR